MRNYHKDTSCPRLALKVDLMKAFDMVDWGFLLETLAAFHFPPKVIMWIKACLTTPKFSISINGELAGFFSGKRGLRQGDPMSPYLFVIATEVLSKILAKHIEDSHSFKFHWSTVLLRQRLMSSPCYWASMLIMLRATSSLPGFLIPSTSSLSTFLVIRLVLSPFVILAYLSSLLDYAFAIAPPLWTESREDLLFG
ncbi:hypothetical protein Dsin_024558 [Dipteronia sinensis]|uniref:Reverse transcriptase domain-containing protein n=1 Tax=Dipteronia sinensis TaxID=43782 RepID=A0AAE0DWC6_9ROSI|nr:hypothetical protein Dsin_024558 [Dipteronia sinensis]